MGQTISELVQIKITNIVTGAYNKVDMVFPRNTLPGSRDEIKGISGLCILIICIACVLKAK